jgi:hypothetical protein
VKVIGDWWRWEASQRPIGGALHSGLQLLRVSTPEKCLRVRRAERRDARVHDGSTPWI